MINKVKNILCTRFNIFDKMDCIPVDPDMLHDWIQEFDTHGDKLIETVTNKYMQIRLFQEDKKINDVKIRKKLRKIYHFRNE